MFNLQEQLKTLQDTLLYSSVETPAGVYVGAMEISVNDIEN